MAGGARLLWVSLLVLLEQPGLGRPRERLRVRFTPAVCGLRCIHGPTGSRCTPTCAPRNTTSVDSGAPGGAAPGGPGFRAFLCPLICHNGGVCVKPDRCLCPPDFAGKFCQLHSSGARPPAPAMPGLTRSVYTMPLANHRDDEHGVASMVSVHVEHPQEASVVVHQVERVSGPWEEANPEALARAEAVARAEAAAPYTVLAQSAPREDGYSDASGFGYCFRELRGSEVRRGRRVGGTP